MDNNKTAKESMILLSPLGLSPGLLYSALMTIKPQHLVLLTSKEGKGSLDEIIQHAKYLGPINIVLVEDPFNCFHEANQKSEEVVSILNYNPCVINLTGGTTALQFIIQRAGTVLENRGCRVEYIALVDRRSVQEQRNNPWVVGDVIRVS